jgi:lactate dehydrogenase-like 2-hydroxyacid dehydrogenase
VSQVAVGFDNINRAEANRYKVPFTNTAGVLNDATAESKDGISAVLPIIRAVVN